MCIPLIPLGVERSVGDIFAKVEFRCLLAGAIGRYELERDRKSKVVIKAWLTVKLYGCILGSIRECGLGVKFCLFHEYSLLSRENGRGEGWKECMKSCIVTRCILVFGKVIIDNLTIAELE